METVLQINHASKTFGKHCALDNVSLTLQKGDIYGLIGRNGAGKTTLLKTIVGLTQLTSGSIQLFGAETNKEYLQQLQRVGNVIETPIAYDQLTALQNLTYYCDLRGIVDPDTPQRILKLVGLTDTKKKKYKNFSLGMKQKLGLGLALLSQPDFLILDEPTNGLDPVAIAEFRELLIRLNQQQQITILISSHILEELFHVATRFGFIHEGQLIHEISKSAFVEASKEFIRLEVDDPAKAAFTLEKMGIFDYKVIGKKRLNIYQKAVEPATVNYALVTNHIAVQALSKESQNLEMYFKNLINS